MPRLPHKTALVVGGTSGLGLEIAKGFAQEGARVLIAGRSIHKRNQAESAFQKEKLPLEGALSVNVTSLASVQKLCAQTFKRFSTLDIVVCTAGMHLKIPTLQMKSEEWRKILDTNLTGTYWVNTVFGERMLRQKSGSLINIASLGSRVALSMATAYNVSKAGVEMLTKCLACEWAAHGLRVNAILPGVFKTPLNEKALSDPARLQNIRKHTPMGRFGKLEEITGAALYLASEESRFVTGTSVVVDGGFLAFAGF